MSSVTKTVCTVFNQLSRHKLVAKSFPLLKLGSSYILFVDCFKYLDHIITDNARDDDDIKREVHNLFVCTNVLIRKFHLCSQVVRITLFKSYCLCMYDVGLWSVYNCGTLSMLKSAYHKCIKLFFGFARHFSVTQILLELGLPSFETLILNSQYSFRQLCISVTMVILIFFALCQSDMWLYPHHCIVRVLVFFYLVINSVITLQFLSLFGANV